MRFLKAAIASIALTAALAQPAAALDRHQYTNVQSGEGQTISMFGLWQVQPNDDGTSHVAFECLANGAPISSGVGLRECYLEGEDGTKYDGLTQEDPEANFGFFTADGNVAANAKSQRHRICMQAAAISREGSNFFRTTLACSPFE